VQTIGVKANAEELANLKYMGKKTQRLPLTVGKAATPNAAKRIFASHYSLSDCSNIAWNTWERVLSEIISTRDIAEANTDLHLD
jgi:hypothetical protein